MKKNDKEIRAMKIFGIKDLDWEIIKYLKTSEICHLYKILNKKTNESVSLFINNKAGEEHKKIILDEQKNAQEHSVKIFRDGVYASFQCVIIVAVGGMLIAAPNSDFSNSDKNFCYGLGGTLMGLGTFGVCYTLHGARKSWRAGCTRLSELTQQLIYNNEQQQRLKQPLLQKGPSQEVRIDL